MNPEKLAYMIYEWRKKYGVPGDNKHDYSCAMHILKVHKELPIQNDWRGWEEIFRYHHI